MLATLSQIRAWSTEHLIDAAGYWTETADRWEDVFLQMRNQAHAIAWNGAGGDGLRQRTRADFSTVSGIADQLRRAATIARNGAGTIDAAQRRVMYAVEDAQDAGFNVGEDLSVTDTKTTQPAAVQAARLAQAQALAGDIRLRVGQLVAAENEVSGQLAATTGDVGNVRFAGAPVVAHSAVQLVDFFKQDGPTPPPPGAPHPSGGADGPYSDPITSMMLPPAGTEAPVSDATKRWVDNMVNELAARPPDDPIAVEARRLAFQALHRPCNSAEWTAAVAGFAGSSAGVVGTALAIPAGPADWALLGAPYWGLADRERRWSTVPPSSATPVVVFSVAVVVVCLIGGVAGSLWPRPAGRLRGGYYFAFMGVAWVLLAISAIANAVKGSLWWDIWSLGLLVLIPAVVYGKMRRSRRISSDQDR